MWFGTGFEVSERRFEVSIISAAVLDLYRRQNTRVGRVSGEWAVQPYPTPKLGIWAPQAVSKISGCGGTHIP